jgi:Fe-S oxidoreductase
MKTRWPAPVHVLWRASIEAAMLKQKYCGQNFSISGNYFTFATL